MDSLKLAKDIVKKYAQSSGKKGMVIDGERVSFKDIYGELTELQGQPKVHRCRDCENYYSAPRAKKGVCMLKSHSLSRSQDDFCSCNYTPRSAERRQMDETVNKLLQKERA